MSRAGSAEPVFYGGQAVLEGVLMRGRRAYALAVRRPGGGIALIEKPVSSAAERWPLLKLPLVRGVAALGSSLALGYYALSRSAEIAFEGTEQQESPFEKWLNAKLGNKVNDVLMVFSMVFAVVLALSLFMLLPALVGSLVPGRLAGVAEGLSRVAIFVAYVFAISRAKDIQRVFGYHGAEHMAINCHERSQPLTAENVARCSRLHKRCGTSFMLVVMVVAMLLFMALPVEGVWARFASRIALLPLVAGISYEISVKWAGRRDNFLVRAIVAPGMLMQRMTTAVPDEGQIEVAITALARCLAQEEGPEGAGSPETPRSPEVPQAPQGPGSAETPE